VDVELTDGDLSARLASWSLPPLPYGEGVFGRYRALVSSASEGAVLRTYPT
jgi:dihydroxy-acid dehydratase